jgi:hypothetical protein
MVSTVTKYLTDDGAMYDTHAEAVEHEQKVRVRGEIYKSLEIKTHISDRHAYYFVNYLLDNSDEVIRILSTLKKKG